MIQLSEARELCSKSEWKLLENSFSPMVETFLRSGLITRIDRIKKLHRKITQLVRMQHSDSRKLTTRRKTELFTEAIGRFEAALNSVENAPGAGPPSKSIDDQKVAKETRTLNTDALQERADRELKSRKTHVLSALALRGKQQGQKSGAKHIQSHVGSVTRRKQARRDSKNG